LVFAAGELARLGWMVSTSPAKKTNR